MNDHDLITWAEARERAMAMLADAHRRGDWMVRSEIERRDRRWIALVLAALVTGLVVGSARSARSETIDGARIIIIDGDTVALPCDPVRGVYPGCAERIRLVGIDAPETGRRARCTAEDAAGLEAKAMLAGLIRGHRIEIVRTGRDRYGRTLARITAGGADVDAAMLAAGTAVPYAPGRAAWADRCRHWCPSADRCKR